MPPELDQMNPGMEPQGSEEVIGLHGDEPDREGAMAKADLFKLANYSHKLFQQIDDNDQLEGWVQAKITKAADYVASVYHYLEYEMKFSDYGKALDDSDVLSEGQKAALKNKLMEAKSKVKELKKAQAEKVNDKKMAEGVLSGGHTTCSECGGTGMVYEAPKPIPDHVKGKVEKYNRQAKAFHAASKRIDANKNGIPDDEELGEETSSTGGEITRGKGFTRHSHNPARFSDEPHAEPASKAKSQSAADKAGSKAADKAEEKEGKNWEKRFGKGSVTRVKDGKKVDEAKEKEPEGTYSSKRFETDGQRVARLAKEKMQAKKKAEAEKKVDEALKGKQKILDVDNDDDIEADDLADLRAGKKKVKEESHQASTTMKHVNASDASDKEKAAIKKASKDIKPGVKGYKDREDALKAAGVKDDRGPANESAPSAGLSKAKKSATAKKAAAGGDIGKPGKSFDKVAKAAGGGEKGEKIAAAAMWKNIKRESQEELEEAKKAKKDYDKDGKIETGAEEHAGAVDNAIKASKAKETVKESAELDRIKYLTQVLRG